MYILIHVYTQHRHVTKQSSCVRALPRQTDALPPHPLPTSTMTYCNTTHCNTLQHVATHCITLQHTATLDDDLL